MYLCFIFYFFIFCFSVGNSVGVKKSPALSVPHPSEVRNCKTACFVQWMKLTINLFEITRRVTYVLCASHY